MIGPMALAAGMRADRTFEFLASALALVGFALCMNEAGELRPEFLADAMFPAPNRAGFGLPGRLSAPATKEIDVREPLRHDAVNAELAEAVWTLPLFEAAAPPVLLCAGGNGRKRSDRRRSHGYGKR